jgi:hypothetical protein
MELNKDIAVWKNVLSAQECEDIINYYERMEQLNLSFSREDLRDAPAHVKNDRTVFPLENIARDFNSTEAFLSGFLNKFWSCYGTYTRHYSCLVDSGAQYIRNIRIQKTLPGQGYHLWHFEQDRRESANRICAWGLYLNTVEQGGETEWLYQSMRIPAEQGSLVLWPAAYTHVHRGNPPLSGEKYLMTGWVEY